MEGLEKLAGLLTPQAPPVKVIVSATCPRGHVLVMDPDPLGIPDEPKGLKIVVTPTTKVAAEISAAIEGASLQLVP